MYIQVRPLQGYQKSLIYLLPPHWAKIPVIGDLITVPLRQQTILATVEKLMALDSNNPPLGPNGQAINMRPALSYDATLNHQDYKIFIKSLRGYYQIPARYLIKRFSVSKVVELMDEYSKNQTKRHYKRLFKKLFGMSDKKMFNGFLKRNI